MGKNLICGENKDLFFPFFCFYFWYHIIITECLNRKLNLIILNTADHTLPDDVSSFYWADQEESGRHGAPAST